MGPLTSWGRKTVALWIRTLGVCLLAGLGACAHKPVANLTSATAMTAGRVAWTPEQIARWQPMQLPGKQPTRYALAEQAGRAAVRAQADSSVSMLRQPLRVEPHELGHLEFAWNVSALIDGADVGLRQSDDSPVRLVLAFDGDRSAFSAKNAVLSELAHAMTGEPLPYATLMYIWCNTRPVGTVVHSPRTDRIRKLVVASGPQQLAQWVDFRRDVRADFELAFGEAPGALLAIALMTDSDNTQSSALAWYGGIALH
jgi:hypothetical protein